MSASASGVVRHTQAVVVCVGEALTHAGQRGDRRGPGGSKTGGEKLGGIIRIIAGHRGVCCQTRNTEGAKGSVGAACWLAGAALALALALAWR